MTQDMLTAIEARWSLETDRHLQAARSDVLALVAAAKAMKFGLAIQEHLATNPTLHPAEAARLKAHVAGLMG